MKPQTQRVYDYMKEFGSITPMQAIEDIGCFRLAARVAELRNEGIEVASEWLGKRNRYGETVRIKRYRLG